MIRLFTPSLEAVESPPQIFMMVLVASFGSSILSILIMEPSLQASTIPDSIDVVRQNAHTAADYPQQREK